MKTKICSVVLIFFAVFLNAQNVNFLDLNLKNSILNITVLNKRAKDLAGNFVKVDANNDGEIQVSEAKNIGYLSLSNNNNITSLVGIEEFVNLTYLDLNSIKISSLDLSFNTKLLELKGNFTALTTMDLSKNVLLNNINLIFLNYFDTIDVSKNINLEYVGFGGNFTKVDISENTKVINVVLASSNLNQLKVAGCNELIYLGLTNPSQLSNLDWSTNLKLKKLKVKNNI